MFFHGGSTGQAVNYEDTILWLMNFLMSSVKKLFVLFKSELMSNAPLKRELNFSKYNPFGTEHLMIIACDHY